MRIKFTWGGGEKYDVFMRIEGVSVSPVYEPIVFGLGTCREAQKLAQCFNAAIEKWTPELLSDNAELPGVGFQYTEPQEIERAS